MLVGIKYSNGEQSQEHCMETEESRKLIEDKSTQHDLVSIALSGINPSRLDYNDIAASQCSIPIQIHASACSSAKYVILCSIA